MSQKGLIPILIVIIIAIALGSYLIYFRLVPTDGKQSQSNYIPGEVLVTFNENTTYKEVRDLFYRLGINDYNNSYWKAENKKPTDITLLSRVDIIKIKTSAGREDELISKLSQEPIVRTAFKNYLLHITK